MVTLKFPSEAVCFSNVSLTKLGKFPEIDRANSLDIMSSGTLPRLASVYGRESASLQPTKHQQGPTPSRTRFRHPVARKISIDHPRELFSLAVCASSAHHGRALDFDHAVACKHAIEALHALQYRALVMRVGGLVYRVSVFLRGM